MNINQPREISRNKPVEQPKPKKKSNKKKAD
jgi:hypothetical protein